MARKTKQDTTPQATNHDAVMAKYPHIIRVVSLSPKQKVARVVIPCEDCGTEREIAVQDCFQVRRCEDCQKESLKARRRKTKAEAKPKADKPKAKAKKAKARKAKPKAKAA